MLMTPKSQIIVIVFIIIIVYQYRYCYCVIYCFLSVCFVFYIFYFVSHVCVTYKMFIFAEQQRMSGRRNFFFVLYFYL